MNDSQILIPHPSRNRALVVIDVQPGFLPSDHSALIRNIVTLIQKGEYQFIILTEFKTLKGSLWEKQVGWSFTHTSTPKEISDVLDPENSISFIKTTKSIFAMKPYLAAELRQRDIEELHLVGYDINDCVMANANDSFDLGFSTYVIEECSFSSQNEKLREAALLILRENEMTNHSDMIEEKRMLG